MTMGHSKAAKEAANFSFRVVQDMDDLLVAFSIRASVFVGEQSCPYREEFDGNDFTATHIIALVNDEPAGTMRIRYFANFVKLERFCIRKEFRGVGLFQRLCAFVAEFVSAKGYREGTLHAHDVLVPLWERGAFRPIDAVTPMDSHPIAFSGMNFKPMKVAFAPPAAALTIDSPPYVLNRAEGAWGDPGVLEKSLGCLVAQR